MSKSMANRLFVRLLLLSVLLLLSIISSFAATEAAVACPSSSNNDNANDNEKQCSTTMTETETETETEPRTQTGTQTSVESAERKSKRKWKWDVDVQHRCNIQKISFDELYQQYPHGLPPLYHQPLILYDHHTNATTTITKTNANPNEKINTNTNTNTGKRWSGGSSVENKNRNYCTPATFTQMSSIQNISTSTFPHNFNVTLSSSNSFSSHRRSIPLSQYIDETLDNDEILPHDLSNLTWYLFGETYSDEWRKMLLRYYCLPPCQTCTDDLSALSFGIGGKGSGVQWHVHGPGFSESIHGTKHWVLYPPEKKPEYDPDYTSRHWMEEVYTTLVSSSSLPFECTVMPGEMIYFPDGWYHATINLSPYTAFISTFTTEHGIAAKP